MTENERQALVESKMERTRRFRELDQAAEEAKKKKPVRFIVKVARPKAEPKPRGARGPRKPVLPEVRARRKKQERTKWTPEKYALEAKRQRDYNTAKAAREGREMRVTPQPVPSHCYSCKRPVRKQKDKPDGVSVQYYSRGRCGTCVRQGVPPDPNFGVSGIIL